MVFCHWAGPRRESRTSHPFHRFPKSEILKSAVVSPLEATKKMFFFVTGPGLGGNRESEQRPEGGRPVGSNLGLGEPVVGPLPSPCPAAMRTLPELPTANKPPPRRRRCFGAPPRRRGLTHTQAADIQRPRLAWA